MLSHPATIPLSSRTLIRDAYGYRDFHDEEVAEPLAEFMSARAWTHAEGAVALFRQTTAWLRREWVLLPGATVLTRLVATVRAEADQRLYQALAEAAAGVDVELPQRLVDLLEVPEGKQVSELEPLRKMQRRDSGTTIAEALERVDEVLSLGARKAQLQAVPANRIAALARNGLDAKAPSERANTTSPSWPSCSRCHGRRCTGSWRRPPQRPPRDERGRR